MNIWILPALLTAKLTVDIERVTIDSSPRPKYIQESSRECHMVTRKFLRLSNTAQLERHAGGLSERIPNYQFLMIIFKVLMKCECCSSDPVAVIRR